MHRPFAMPARSFMALALVGALVGCGAANSASFGDDGGATVSDALPSGDTDITLDTGAAVDGGPPDGETTDAAALPKCPPPPSGKANVCIRVLRGDVGPSLTADAKKLLGIDGNGILAVGLASAKPEHDATFVAKTLYPSASSGVSKIAAADLPRVVEALTVDPGTYWPYGAFRDAEPWDRAGHAVGDFVPRIAELSPLTVTEGASINIDLTIHPLRGIDLRPKLAATPLGSGAGPARAWILHPLKGLLLGEGAAPCLDLNLLKVEPIRVFTTYTGSFDAVVELFDFGLGTDPAGLLSPGGIHGLTPKVDVLAGDWLALERRVDLGDVVPFIGTKPADSSPNCTAFAGGAPTK